MKFYSRRAYYCGRAQAAQVGQNSFISLYNASPIGNILRVRYWWVNNTTAQNDMRHGFIQGILGGTPISGFPLWPDQAATGGVTYVGTNATQQIGVGQQITNAPSPLGWATELPIWYIQPGYSLVANLNFANAGFAAGYVWEDLPVSMLEHHEIE